MVTEVMCPGVMAEGWEDCCRPTEREQSGCATKGRGGANDTGKMGRWARTAEKEGVLSVVTMQIKKGRVNMIDSGGGCRRGGIGFNGQLDVCSDSLATRQHPALSHANASRASVALNGWYQPKQELRPGGFAWVERVRMNEGGRAALNGDYRSVRHLKYACIIYT